MKLAELFDQSYKIPGSLASKEVLGLSQDSRNASQGIVFFAIEGSQRDGHEFIETLLNKSVHEKPLAIVASETSAKLGALTNHELVIKVPDTRKALGEAASRFYGTPSRRLTVCGVTGTNGKTTSTYLLESLLSAW